MQKHKDLLYYAEYDDLKIALQSLNSGDPSIRPILYHAQQCAEKTLKGFLCYKKKLPPKIHDLVILVEHCAVIDKDFKSLLFAAAELNPYCTKTRYPDSGLYSPDISLAEDAVKQAKTILEFVKAKIDKR